MKKHTTEQDVQIKQTLTVQQAVQRMQHDLASKGAVRPEDLLKVLGDPTSSVKVTLQAGYLNFTRHL